MANGLLTRDDIARIYNSDTPINNFGLTRDEIASIYNGPSAVESPSQPIQAQEIPVLKPIKAEEKAVDMDKAASNNTFDVKTMTNEDKRRTDAKDIGRSALKKAKNDLFRQKVEDNREQINERMKTLERKKPTEDFAKLEVEKKVKDLSNKDIVAKDETGLTENAKVEIADLERRRDKLLNYGGIQNERRAQKLQEQIDDLQQKGIASNEDYLVSRDRYDQLMQNPDMADDIDNLTDIIYNPRRAGGKASADAISEKLTKMDSESYINSLVDKYGLSREELEDMALTRQSDRRNDISVDLGEKAAEFGKEHKKLGTALSLAESIGNGVEGAYNTIAGLTTDDNRRFSKGFNSTKTGLREGVKENYKTELGKGAYDVITGLGDLGVGALTGNAPLMLAGNTANQAILGADAKGQSARKAATYGALSGAADYYFNKVGLDKAKEMAFEGIKSVGAKELLARLGVSAGAEAGENVLQDITQSFLDEVINGNRSDLRTAYEERVAEGMDENKAFAETAGDYAKQLLQSGATGALMGAGMFGAHSIGNAVKGGMLQNALKDNSQDVWDRVRASEDNALDKAQRINEEPLEIDRIPDESVRQLNDLAEEDVIKDKIPFDPRTVNAGRATHIEKPYKGVVPIQSSSGLERYKIPYQDGVDTSNRVAIDVRETGAKKKTALQEAFKNLFASRGKDIQIHDMLFKGDPYKVNITNESVKKIINSNFPEADILSVMNELDEVIKRGNYVGSGEYIPHKNKNVDVIREDYFELPISVNDSDYILKFSVESKPGTNDFKTYHLVNEIDLVPEGYANTDTVRRHALPEQGQTDSLSNSNINQIDNSVNSDVPEASNNLNPGSTNGTPETVDTTPRVDDTITQEGVNPETPQNLENTDIPSDVPPSEITNGDVNPPEMGQRRSITNTGVKSGVVGANELESDPELQDIVGYEKHSNDKTYNQAKTDIDTYGDQWRESFSSGAEEINNDLNLDRAMILLNDDTLSEWSRNSILRNLAEHGTQAGQFIQAFSKWANTAMGALAKATKVDSDTVKKWETRNKSAASANERLSSELKRAIDTITDYSEHTPDDPKILPIIRQEVANTIDAYKNTWIADMNKVNRMMGDDTPFEFSGEDIDYLAHMIDHGATVKELKDALNTKLATGRFGISEETQNSVNQLFQYAKQFDPDSREFVEAQAEAFRLLAEEVAPKASPLEKFDTWRYMAMLGNPKTMLRNYVGNKLFSAVTGVSNNLAAAMEKGVDAAHYARTGEHIQRTKEFLNLKADKPLIDGAKKFAENTAWRQVEGPKYEKMDRDSLKGSRSAFDSDVMQLAEKAVNKGISDTKAVINKFSTSMAGYMKANGLDTSAFDDYYKFKQLERDSKSRLLSPQENAEMESLRSTANEMDKAREYALKSAEYATFHEDNAVAKFLTSTSTKARNSENGVVRGLGYALEGTVPFKKTPANILRSGFEYSPFGAIKSIKETGKLIYENTGSRKGNLADEYTHTNKLSGKDKTVQKSLAADVIDSWSKTLTGSAMTALGFYLFDKGVLTSSEKGEKYQDQLEGKGNYAININGHTFTLDWAAPGVMPLLVGAEISKVMEANGRLKEEWYSNPDKWLETVNALLDPMLETSMMSGVKDTLTNAANEVRFNEDNALGGILGSIAGNTITGYLTQGIPTLSGQIARTVDPIRRTTDTKNEGVLGTLEKQARKVANKIPFLSKINAEYRDAYGREQYNSPFEYEEGETGLNALKAVGNLAYQMGLPSYYSKVNETDADKMSRYVYNSEDSEGLPILDEKVFADWRSTKKINGEKLNPRQMQTFREKMGETNYALRDSLANAEWFQNADAETQAEILKSLNTISDKVGQFAVKPKDVTMNSKLEAYLNAGGGEKGIQAVVDELEAEYNPYGLSKDTYNTMKADGENLEAYRGYGQALEEFGLSDNKTNREAWTTGGQQSLKEINDYNTAFVNAGMEKVYTSESARNAYNSGKLEQYKDYREALTAANKNDSSKLWEEYQKTGSVGGITEETVKLDESLKSWSDFNAPDNIYTTQTYERAQKVFPGLTQGQFANTFNAINTNGNTGNTNITHDEVIAYLNKNNIKSSEGIKIWNAYLSNPTEKTIPVLEGGTWVKKKVNK